MTSARLGTLGTVTRPDQQPQTFHQPLPPPGWIALSVQGNRWTASPFAPVVRLNGQVVPASYGENVLPVHPGRIRVDARCQLVAEYGHAAIDVDVAPGQTVPVSYAPPMHRFAPGRIGPGPQPREGMLAAVLLLSLQLFLALTSLALAVGSLVLSYHLMTR